MIRNSDEVDGLRRLELLLDSSSPSRDLVLAGTRISPLAFAGIVPVSYDELLSFSCRASLGVADCFAQCLSYFSTVPSPPANLLVSSCFCRGHAVSFISYLNFVVVFPRKKMFRATDATIRRNPGFKNEGN